MNEFHFLTRRTVTVLSLLALAALGAVAASDGPFGGSKSDGKTKTPVDSAASDSCSPHGIDLRSLGTLQDFEAIWKSLDVDAPQPNPGKDDGPIHLSVTVDTFDNGHGIFTKPNAFEPNAGLRDNGRGIELRFRGEEEDCTPGVTEQVRIIVAQESTGAIATCLWTAGCGAPSKVVAVAHALKGSGKFEVGTATACAVRRIRQNGQVLETFHWCRDVALK